jgi:hypothetical protein
MFGGAITLLGSPGYSLANPSPHRFGLGTFRVGFAGFAAGVRGDRLGFALWPDRLGVRSSLPFPFPADCAANLLGFIFASSVLLLDLAVLDSEVLLASASGRSAAGMPTQSCFSGPAVNGTDERG